MKLPVADYRPTLRTWILANADTAIRVDHAAAISNLAGVLDSIAGLLGVVAASATEDADANGDAADSPRRKIAASYSAGEVAALRQLANRYSDGDHPNAPGQVLANALEVWLLMLAPDENSTGWS